MRDLQTGNERKQLLVLKVGQLADGHARFGWAVRGQARKVNVGRDDIDAFLLVKTRAACRFGYRRESRTAHIP